MSGPETRPDPFAAGPPTGSPPPQRVRVTGPRAVRRPPGRPALAALDEQDIVGDLLVRSLVRAQLGLALRVGAVFVLLLGSLPLAFLLAPALGDVTVLGLRPPWLLLGVLVHPVLLGGGLLYVRLAERNEREFVELVEQA